MDNDMKELYNSMSSAEKAKYQREMRKQLNEAGRQVGTELKKEVHKSGIVGTLLKGAGYIALSILTGGK
ncbi:hypothetical protein [Treponema phagedenis]|uniref:hypothetical protein n=1 Tax=Treponema phagedenis TaxID=162 RepID=UPI0015A4B44B|nr:hypothetical protein [Treponema phagedenis]NVP24301.1 hypothetical protein [Treponema phagedenis]QLC59808.1 hypothetical protein HW453_14125 [Treponema phagedenis]